MKEALPLQSNSAEFLLLKRSLKFWSNQPPVCHIKIENNLNVYSHNTTAKGIGGH
jgi:hypothetical protein